MVSKNGPQSLSYNRRWANNADNKAEKTINDQQGCDVSNAREADKFVDPSVETTGKAGKADKNLTVWYTHSPGQTLSVSKMNPAAI